MRTLMLLLGVVLAWTAIVAPIGAGGTFIAADAEMVAMFNEEMGNSMLTSPVTTTSNTNTTASAHDDFSAFIKRHRKAYRSPTIAAKRHAAFQENLKRIQELNEQFGGAKSAKKGRKGAQAQKEKKPKANKQAALQPRFAAKPTAGTAATKKSKSTKKTSTAKTSTKKASAKASISKPSFDPYGPAVFGITKFSDLTPAEFKKRFLLTTSPSKQGASASKKTTKKSPAKAPRFAAVASSSDQAPKPPPPPPPPPKPKIGTGAFSNAASEGTESGGNQVVFTEAEIATFREQSKRKPAVPYKRYGPGDDVLSDWSAVSPIIRNTDSCGACWAVTAADLLQASYFRAFNFTSAQFSAQYLIDCVAGAYNNGCSGGSVQTAVSYLVDSGISRLFKAGFLYREQEYPWRYPTAANPTFKAAMCKEMSDIFQKSRHLISTWSWAVYPATAAMLTDVRDFELAQTGGQTANKLMSNGVQAAPGGPEGAAKYTKMDREAILAMQLNRLGPLAVAIDGHLLQNYVGGILAADALRCNQISRGDHSMLLVGLQQAPNGTKYWILKNSWGKSWGVNGYLWLKRGNNVCGITNNVVYINIHGDRKDPIAVDADLQHAKYLNKDKTSTYQPRSWSTLYGELPKPRK